MTTAALIGVLIMAGLAIAYVFFMVGSEYGRYITWKDLKELERKCVKWEIDQK